MPLMLKQQPTDFVELILFTPYLILIYFLIHLLLSNIFRPAIQTEFQQIKNDFAAVNFISMMHIEY